MAAVLMLKKTISYLLAINLSQITVRNFNPMKTETEQMIGPPDEEDIHRNYLHPAPITTTQFAFLKESLPLHLVIY